MHDLVDCICGNSTTKEGDSNFDMAAKATPLRGLLHHYSGVQLDLYTDNMEGHGQFFKEEKEIRS